MSISVAQISKKAFDRIARATDGIVFDAKLIVTAQGAYDPVTATHRVHGDVYSGGEIDTDYTNLDTYIGGDADTDYMDLDIYDFSGGDAAVSLYDCRLIVTKTPKDGQIGTYIVTEKERVCVVEGLSIVPEENQILAFRDERKTITFVDDILGSGSFFNLVVR